MDQQEFLRLADDYLQTLSRKLESFDADELDYTLGDGILTMEFGDGARFVLNRQAASQQLWLAAGARAWHYGWDAAAQAWQDDRDGHQLTARLGEVLSAKLGSEVAL